MNEIGNHVTNEDGVEGTIIDIRTRYCAVCLGYSKCYIIKWEDGKTTKPCVKHFETKE